MTETKFHTATRQPPFQGAAGIELIQSVPGLLTIRGDCAALLFKLLGTTSRRESIVLQIAVPGRAAPMSVSGRLNYVNEQEFRLQDVPPFEEGNLLGRHEGASIARVLREGLPKHPKVQADYNPLLCVWDRSVNDLPSELAPCLCALMGKRLRVSFELEGGEKVAVEGTLSSTRTEKGGFVFIDGERRQTLPDPEKTTITIRSIEVLTNLSKPATWRGNEMQAPDTNEVLRIRSDFAEGTPIQVVTFSGTKSRGTYAGIDDRFLPILALRMGDDTFTYLSLPLREVASIETALSQQADVLRTAWKAPN
jgi:hypothetical protein